MLRKRFSFDAVGKDVLDIGAGQYLLESRYFAVRNRVTAIDTDVIVEGFSPAKWMESLRYNGVTRTAKSLFRKLSGIDRQYDRAICEALHVSRLPHVNTVRGDACSMQFADGSFDMAFSNAVLHHLVDPRRALSEVARVLRVGGIATAGIHLYTSHNGSLDPRVMSGDDRSLYWGHLRGKNVQGNAFVNRLRLSEWREIFSAAWPGCSIETIHSHNPHVPEELGRLTAAGELSEYAREELVTSAVVAVWQKPHGVKAAMTKSAGSA
ncbi:MAG: class I SAM-dependent methyltransferase [Candidatus Acidiferrales bacterium]